MINLFACSYLLVPSLCLGLAQIVFLQKAWRNVILQQVRSLWNLRRYKTILSLSTPVSFSLIFHADFFYVMIFRVCPLLWSNHQLLLKQQRKHRARIFSLMMRTHKYAFITFFLCVNCKSENFHSVFLLNFFFCQRYSLLCQKVSQNQKVQSRTNQARLQSLYLMMRRRRRWV